MLKSELIVKLNEIEGDFDVSFVDHKDEIHDIKRVRRSSNSLIPGIEDYFIFLNSY